jgi:hypothetical protein
MHIGNVLAGLRFFSGDEFLSSVRAASPCVGDAPAGVTVEASGHGVVIGDALGPLLLDPQE